MGVRRCRGADCDWDHNLFRINIERKYQSTKRKKEKSARQTKNELKCYRARKL